MKRIVHTNEASMSKLVRPCGVSVNRGVTSDSVYVVFGAVQSANKPHTHHQQRHQNEILKGSLWHHFAACQSATLARSAKYLTESVYVTIVFTSHDYIRSTIHDS